MHIALHAAGLRVLHGSVGFVRRGAPVRLSARDVFVDAQLLPA
jgi:hypothetical protein